LRVIAHHHMNVVFLRVYIVQQPLRVKRAAGAGQGHHYFHWAALINRFCTTL
jgi:hypothetical protein